MDEVVEDEVPPLAAAFLDLLGQSTFALVREQGQASHITQISLQDRRFSIVSLNSSFPIRLQGFREIRRYV
jgi:hypothetical protein